MAHGMDAVDPSGQRGHVADAFIARVVKRLLRHHGGGIMRAFDMHAAAATIRDFHARAHRQRQPTLHVRTWSEIADMYLDTYRRVLSRVHG